MDFVYSSNLSKIIENGGFHQLKPIVEEEFVSCTKDCNKLVTRLSSTKHNFILPSPWKERVYFLFLGLETPFLSKDNPLLFKGIVKHEKGHVPFISKDPQPAPSLILRMKEIFGLVPDITKEHMNHFLGKLTFQNTLIDIGIISSQDIQMADEYIQNCLEEHMEDMEMTTDFNSSDFSKICASILQRGAVARYCTRRPWYSFGTDLRLNEIKSMTYDFRDRNFKSEERRRLFDRGLKILSNSKKEYNWKLFNGVFSDMVSI